MVEVRIQPAQDLENSSLVPFQAGQNMAKAFMFLASVREGPNLACQTLVMGTALSVPLGTDMVELSSLQQETQDTEDLVSDLRIT
jgi:hypothetical protein